MANALFISLATAQEYHNISDFATFINNIFTLLLSLGAIFATLRTVYGHYLYMRSDKSSDELSRAKSIVGDAVVGLIVLFGIYIVLFNINPILIKNNDQLILFNFDSLFEFDYLNYFNTAIVIYAIQLVSTGWFTLVAIVISISLFWLRSRNIIIYGVIEIFVALAMIGFTTKFSEQNASGKMISIVGGIYVMIRGLDNCGRWMSKNSKWWTRIFPAI